jgi:hypothetical protein
MHLHKADSVSKKIKTGMSDNLYFKMNRLVTAKTTRVLFHRYRFG